MARYQSIPKVISLLRAQIEGIKSDPGIVEGLPRPLTMLVSQLATLETANRMREELEKKVVAATEAVQKAAFEARCSARVNLKVLARTRGKYSPDMALLGGKPYRGGRRASEATFGTEVEKTDEPSDEAVA